MPSAKSAKARFPGRPTAQNGRLRPKISTKNKVSKSHNLAAKKIQDEMKNSKNNSEDSEMVWHGFTDEELERFAENNKQKIEMLQETFHGFQEQDLEVSKQSLELINQVLEIEVPTTSASTSESKAKKVPKVKRLKKGKGIGKKSKVNEQQKSGSKAESLAESGPSSAKVLIRPSKLGAIGNENKGPESEENCPFSRGNGKRQIKPSFKLKESSFSLTPTKVTPKNTPSKESIESNSSTKNEAKNSPISSPGLVQKPIIRESKLVLNKKLLERLRKPSHQVEFYSAIQRSLQCADKVPPKLVEGSKNINPAGTALVEDSIDPSGNSGGNKNTATNNRMPGNIVCGICGAVRYYAFILQAKKFGTFSCEPCRKFISKTIKKVENDNQNDEEDELFPCLSGSGKCVVPPMLRSVARKKQENESRCQACWLKLCLLGYNLEADLYNKLRSRLPIVFHDLLPDDPNVKTLPNRGEILQFKVAPLSRPLFEGFGEQPVAVQEQPKELKKAKIPVVIERLPNGWSKKAVKRKGKWDTYLLTPDQRTLKTQLELKLYIAKSGAVIDSNIVNFSMPKRTAKIDKKLTKSSAKIDKKDPFVDIETVDNEKIKSPKAEAGVKRPRKTVIVVPRSSRRDIKVPLKYRQDQEEQEADEQTLSTPVKTPSQKTSTIPKESPKNILEPSTPIDESTDAFDSFEIQEPSQEELRVAILQESATVAVKSQPKKSIQELSKMGVGTFSIDSETAKNMVSGRFVSKIKVKRCGLCKNCRKRNCKECIACKDMPKYGGQGQLKQACIYRRCTNPTPKKKYMGMDVSLKDEDIIEPMDQNESLPIPENEKKVENKIDANKIDEDELMEEDDLDDNPLNPNDSDLIPRIPVPPRSMDRPKYSYSALIAMAIQNSPGQRASLGAIYDWIQDAFPYFAGIDKTGWQNSIRHNLSLHKSFYRTQHQSARKGGGIWRIDPKFAVGAFRKVTKSNSKPKSIKANESFWEPDNDSYIDTRPKVTPLPPKPNPVPTPDPPQPKENRDERRQSIEEFIEMGLSAPSSPTKVYIDAIPEVPIPLPPVELGTSSSKKIVIKVDNLDNLKKSGKTSGETFLGSTDYFEAYDPEQVSKSGQAVITTETISVEALCFLCGSAGEEDLLLCKGCCEPYHPFCLNPEELPQTSEAEVNWLCRKCIQCQICGRNEGQRLRCSQCTNAFHKLCLLPSQQKMVEQQSKESWKCGTCLKCSSCNVANVAHFDEIDLKPLCDSCCLQKKKGSFCPLCEQCYDDTDYDVRMMECINCGGWIHAKCEGVDAEKYQILSYLPNDVEFSCKCGSPVPKTKEDADLSSLLGQSVAIAVVDDPANISNSPMHTKEFQILSESTLDVAAAAAAEFVESTEAEIVEFVDVPTDVHPLSEEMPQQQ